MNPTSKGGFHVFLYIWGFTHLSLNNILGYDEILSNPRKEIKYQQETHVGMNFYQTLGLGQATNHAIVWKFIQEFIVPYKKSKVSYLFYLGLNFSSLLLLFLFLFFSLFLFPSLSLRFVFFFSIETKFGLKPMFC